MISQNLKLPFRSMLRNKTAAFINIGGLAFAMCVCMLIGLWVHQQLTYNSFHTNVDRIAKVRQNIGANGNIITDKVVPLPLANELRTSYNSDFKFVVRSSHRMPHLLATGEKIINQQGVFMDRDAPAMLQLKVLTGTSSGLDDPHGVMLAASASSALFGNENPIDKIVTLDNKLELKVTGIYADLPANSTFSNLKFIAPFELYMAQEKWLQPLGDNWDKSPIQLYVQVQDNKNINDISLRLKNLASSQDVGSVLSKHPRFFLEPMDQWHLYSTYKNGVVSGGKIRYVRMFTAIGVLILVLACINFMNLTTARSRKKALEVGVRKTIGSLRYQLITKFYVESFITVLLALVIAIMLTVIFLPMFNETMVMRLVIPWTNPVFWLACIGFITVTAMLAGSYPALFLSSFKPIKVLKGELTGGKSSALWRKSLVVIQFSICICMLFSTITISKQIDYGKDRYVGYDPDKLLQVYLPAGNISQHINTLKNELAKTGKVESMAMSEGTITDIWGTDNALDWKNKNPNLEVDFPNTGVSPEFGKTMRWQFVAGRDFTSDLSSDSSAFVLNEAAVRFMKLDNPIGETIRLHGKPFTVIGVIKDVIVESPFLQVRPSMYCLSRGYDNFLFIRINKRSDNMAAIKDIEKTFKKFSTTQPFDYKFVEDEYNAKFADEIQTSKLSKLLSALAVLISALGLFGLTTFITEQRSKELGLRKLLGASVLNLWLLLTAEFVILVILSCILAAPVAGLYLANWLQKFEYRTSIDWSMFVIVGIGALTITIVTVSVKAIKAAFINPVESIRTQ